MIWLPITESEPPNGQAVLVTDGRIVTIAERSIAHDRQGKLHDDWDVIGVSGYEWEWDYEGVKFTHYMNLPEPPGKEKPMIPKFENLIITSQKGEKFVFSFDGEKKLSITQKNITIANIPVSADDFEMLRDNLIDRA